MRIKTILSIAAFSFAFIFSTAFAGLFLPKSAPVSNLVVVSRLNTKPTSCFKNRGNNSTARKIEVLLKQDDDNGRTHALKIFQSNGGFRPLLSSLSFDEYAEATAEYADKSGSIDDDGLPQEFQTAWQNHMKAWRDYADFLGKAESMNLDDDKYIQFDEKFNNDIKSTWQQVLLSGAKYGANVPPMQ